MSYLVHAARFWVVSDTDTLLLALSDIPRQLRVITPRSSVCGILRSSLSFFMSAFRIGSAEGTER